MRHCFPGHWCSPYPPSNPPNKPSTSFKRPLIALAPVGLLLLTMVLSFKVANLSSVLVTAVTSVDPDVPKLIAYLAGGVSALSALGGLAHANDTTNSISGRACSSGLGGCCTIFFTFIMSIFFTINYRNWGASYTSDTLLCYAGTPCGDAKSAMFWAWVAFFAGVAAQVCWCILSTVREPVVRRVVHSDYNQLSGVNIV